MRCLPILPGIRFYELRVDNFVVSVVPGTQVGAENLRSFAWLIFAHSPRKQDHTLPVETLPCATAAAPVNHPQQFTTLMIFL